MHCSAAAPEVEAIIALITAWFSTRADVQAIVVVGSVVRGTARPDSDLDLVLLVDDPTWYRTDQTWVTAIPWQTIGLTVSDIKDADFGALWSRFVTLTAGPPVELGFASPYWASTDPLDTGTAQVVRDGCRICYDPIGLLVRLVAAVRREGR